MSTLHSAKNAQRSKKIGRPAVDGEAVNVRLARTKIAEIDDWRRVQPDLPGRPEAIRRLVDKALRTVSR